jgi:hypothetical protein
MTETPTITLAEFLHARIAEDEQWVGGQPLGRWGCVMDSYPPTYPPWTPDNLFRVLAECAAKRQIIELHGLNDGTDWPVCLVCCDSAGYEAELYPCATLRLLAVPYADHPDYRQEWRP